MGKLSIWAVAELAMDNRERAVKDRRRWAVKDRRRWENKRVMVDVFRPKAIPLLEYTSTPVSRYQLVQLCN